MSDYIALDVYSGADRINTDLISGYGYDLFDFAYSIAIALSKKPLSDFWNIWTLKKTEVADYKFVADEVKKLKRIKRRLQQVLDLHLSAMQNIRNPLLPKEPMPASENWENRDADTRELLIEKIYGLESIRGEIDILRGCLNLFKRAKGKPAKPFNIIASLWSLIMKNEEIHLDNIYTLINWFHERLEGTDYRNELDTSEHPPRLKVISEFMENYEDLLEEDKKKIFFHSYRELQDKEKVYAFQIRYEVDNPRLYPFSSPPDETEQLIVFTDGSTFPE